MKNFNIVKEYRIIKRTIPTLQKNENQIIDFIPKIDYHVLYDIEERTIEKILFFKIKSEWSIFKSCFSSAAQAEAVLKFEQQKIKSEIVKTF